MINCKWIASGTLAFLLAAGPCAAAETPSFRNIPSTIEKAAADVNEETSTALTAILSNCADAYRAVDTMHATGNYAYARKYDKKTTYSTAKIKLDFKRPDKIAAIVESEADYLDGGFVADGTTVTQYFRNTKRYTLLPQQPLASYVGTYRAGEINEDFTDNLRLISSASLLFCDDVDHWIHENVTRYIYEGDEDVSGASCYRVRFNQDPLSLVVLWIDKKTFLIQRISVISSYDEDGELVESFEDGDNATMRVITWDKISTRPKDLPKNAFRASVPKKYTHYMDEPDPPVNPAASRGFWGNLVNLAAGTSSQETTWSLEKHSGSIDLRLEEFVNTTKPVTDMDTNESLDGKSDMVGLAFEDGVIEFYTNDGKRNKTVKVKDGISLFAYRDTTTSGPVIVTADKQSRNLNAFDMDGNLYWQYYLPFARINNLQTDWRPATSLYLDMGYHGLRKLDINGNVLFANSEFTYPNLMAPAPNGTDRFLLDADAYGINILDKSLRKLSSFDTDEVMNSYWWDAEDADHPLITLAVTSENDVLLQRRSTRGDIAWTTMIEPNTKNAVGALMLMPTLKIDGKPQECLMVLLTDGRLTVADKSGKIIYRGKVSANDALVEQNGGYIMKFFLWNDVDGDGSDEIYFPLHTHMMRLKTP